jgi:short-subunit dehydrogenase
MIARRRGHLVGVASIAADLPVPMMAAYGSSKAGLSHLLQALRPNLRSHNVFATVVHPGFVKTPFLDGATIRLPGLMALDPAADIIYRGIRKKKAVIRFPLRVKAAIGVFSVLPRPLRDWVVRRMRL